MNFPQKIEKVITRYLRYKKARLAIGIVIDNKTYILNYSDQKIDCHVSSDYYDIGSLSKIFTSLLIMQMVSEGKISLKDNIKQYLSLPKGQYWTIGDLLKHRCDFWHLTPFQIVLKSLLRAPYEKRNIYQDISEKEVIKEAIRRRKHINKRRYGYSDFSTALLTLVVQEIKHNAFVLEMDTFIKQMFNLRNTQCIKDNSFKREAFIGNKQVKPWEWKDDNPYVLGGGIVSTIEDMTSFVKQLIERQNEPFIKESFNCDKEDEKHNLTWFLSKRKTSFWHVGGAGTFRSSMIINPKRRIGLVVLGNQMGRKSGNTHYLAKMIYTNIRRHKITFE